MQLTKCSKLKTNTKKIVPTGVRAKQRGNKPSHEVMKRVWCVAAGVAVADLPASSSGAMD